MGVTQNPQGWTDVTPAADTKIAYVDATAGDDGTAVFYDWNDVAIGADPYNPVGPINAYQTSAAAFAVVRDGMADWVLYKRGEVWTDAEIAIYRTGRSASEPTYIGAYGPVATDRPLFKSGIGFGLMLRGSDGNVIVQSIEFYSHVRNPSDPDWDPSTGDLNNNTAVNLQVLSDATAVRDSYLIEDCKFGWFSQGLHTEKLNSSLPSPTNGRVRRCVFHNSWSSGGHAQGMFITEVDDFLVEECMFDHNGWLGDDRDNPVLPFTGPDGLSHNIYWSAYCPFGTKEAINNVDNRGRMIFRDNFTLDASGAGVQMRSGGDMTGNVSWHDPWPLLNGDPSGQYDVNWPDGTYGTMNGNLVQDAIDVNTTTVGGIHLRCRNNQVLSINDNLCIGQLATSLSSQPRLQVASNSNPHDTRVDDMSRNIFNSVVKGGPWEVSAGRSYGIVNDNHWWNAAAIPYATVGTNRNGEDMTYMDDTRRIETYATDALGLASIDEFWDVRRNMHRGNWDTAYMTPAVQQWIREGFAAPSGPNSPTNLTVTVA